MELNIQQSDIFSGLLWGAISASLMALWQS